MSETMQTPVTRREKFLYKIAGGEIDLPTPITRVELYLFVIAGGTIDLPTPEIRCEYFLAKAAGMDVAVPTPITRWEKYLYKLCGYEIELPTPVTREEMYLYLAGSAEERTVTGIPPLTIVSDGTDATVGLMGNMQQTGTPSPTTPIQPSECGDRTGNLFDYTKTDGIIANKYINQRNSIVTDNEYYLSYPIKVNVGETYTWRFNSNEGISHTAPTVGFYDSSDNLLSTAQHDATVRYFSFEVPANCAYIRASVFTRSNVQKEAMLNTGSQPLPYEPYGVKIPISSANTTTPVYLGEVESTRQIVKYEFTGEENWIRETGNTYALEGVKQTATGYANAICTHYVLATSYSTLTGTDGTFSVSRRPALFIHDENFTTAAQLKTYLATQYANGTPVVIYYTLDTPETAVVNEPIRKIGTYADTVSGITIPTAVGSNTVDVDTTLKPSEMTITYRG